MALADLQYAHKAGEQENCAEQSKCQHYAEPGSHGQCGLMGEVEVVVFQDGACIEPRVLVSAAVDLRFVFLSEFVQGLVRLDQLFR